MEISAPGRLPTKLHSKLQSLIVAMLKVLGYFAYVEVTLRVAPNWEPIPDVIAELEASTGPYPTKPVDIVVEILSPEDEFSFVQDKCKRYSNIGVNDILVLDPIRHTSWVWHSHMKCLVFVGSQASGASPLLDSAGYPPRLSGSCYAICNGAIFTRRWWTCARTAHVPAACELTYSA